jgi:hypothetical protein
MRISSGGSTTSCRCARAGSKLHLGDADAVWVVHAFQKKSKTGIKTPKAEIDLIRPAKVPPAG